MPPATDFFLLICRITEANLYDVWRTANVSSDEELMRACVPTLVSHYAAAPIDTRFLAATELRGLKCLLSNDRSQRLSARSRVSAVAAWVKAAPTGESQQLRTNAFTDLVALIEISNRDSADFFFDDNIFSLSASCR